LQTLNDLDGKQHNFQALKYSNTNQQVVPYKLGNELVPKSKQVNESIKVCIRVRPLLPNE
jgi:hypothetical protein